MKKLIIAEKPSVARELAKNLKKGTNNKDYFENDNYIITSLFGHLLELYNMEDYDKEYLKWNIEDLPFYPKQFKWKLKKQKGIKERYNLVQKLIKRNDVEVIINCGDADREGEVLVNNIIYDIFERNKIQKAVKRILLPDLAANTIKTELNNLRDIKNTDNWYQEGLARTYVDWLYGINFSRFVSLKTNDRFPVGRVIVPTVKFVYDREMEIKNFKEERYFQIQGIINKDDKELKLEFGDKVKIVDGKEENIKKEIQKKINLIKNKKAKVKKIEEKEKIRKPKKLFSLKTLQNYMFSKYKTSINDTLKYAQNLYEKTYTTYPRTNSEYLTEEEQLKVQKIIEKLLKEENLNIEMKKDKRIFDSSKVESHSAIIITGNKINNLDINEEKVYNSIKNRFLANFCKDDCIIKEQNIIFETEIGEAKVKGTLIKQKGYLKYENDISENVIADFIEGEEVDIEFKIIEKKTTPPGKVTEAELNNFYENPFKKEKQDIQEETTDEDYIAIMQGCEIGTPATRAGIIEKVKKDGYIVNNKNALEITEKGIKLIEVLDKLRINLSKEKTVEIGKELKAIYNNQENIDDILTNVKKEIDSGINKEIEIQTLKREIKGKCPICGKNIYESSKSFYCEDRIECKFLIMKIICKKKLSNKNIKDLLKEGKTDKISGFKSKTGKIFSASLVIQDNRIKLNFDNEKK